MMEARRELDALIAEKVMGWKHVPYTAYADEKTAIEKGWFYWVDADGDEIIGQLGEHSFSTDIAAAYQVVQHLENQGWDFRLESDVGKAPHSGLLGKRYYMGAFLKDYAFIREYADTAPHAICLAALKAVGV